VCSNRCRRWNSASEVSGLQYLKPRLTFTSSCLHRASIVSKTHFIIPNDAHYYKIIEMLKQFKITILAPTCYGSRRNHHQGAVLCLTKTTKKVFSVLVSIDTECVMAAYHWLRLYWRAQQNHFVVLAKHRTAPWWWFLREPKQSEQVL